VTAPAVDRQAAPWVRVALGALTVIFVVLGLLQAARDAPTVDEAPDLVAALVTVQKHDLRMNPEHGVLHHALPGVLPVLLADPLLPETEAYESGAWFDYTDDVIAVNDQAGRLDDVLFWFRVVPLLAGAAVGWVLFALGRRIGGDLGGLIAAGLWLTTPYVVGLAHLGSLDVSFALAVAGLVLAVVRDREAPTPATAFVVAVVLGAALATRHSAVVLVPVAIAFVVAHRWADRRTLARGLFIALVVPVAFVWLVHRSLDPVPVEGPPRERFDAIVANAASQGPLERLVLAFPMPIEWKAGFGYLALTSDARSAYLLGSNWAGGRVWFYPASALVKLPAPASLAVISGIVLLAVRHRRHPVVPPLTAVGVTIAVFLVLQPLNMGLRLALPVVALAMIASASLASLRRLRAGPVTLGLLAATQLAAMIAAHPTSLAWTPPPFSDGYRAVGDSSIDFGQALFTLRDAHAKDPFVAVSVIVPRGLWPPAGTVAVEEAAPHELVGRVAVGVTALTSAYVSELSWLRAYCPVDVLDHAVLVYEFDDPPDMAPGPGTPAAPCEGAISRRG
jgi:4-amino-4-deoxy-L-arabinose transferase-like glycosyltransferase